MSEITTNEIVPAVKATQVHKAFGNLHVLKGIDMTVMPGTVTVILGPSGSGKSTFLRLINQLETLTGGEIDVDGEMIGYKYVDKGGERVLQTLTLHLQTFRVECHFMGRLRHRWLSRAPSMSHSSIIQAL